MDQRGSTATGIKGSRLASSVQSSPGHPTLILRMDRALSVVRILIIRLQHFAQREAGIFIAEQIAECRGPEGFFHGLKGFVHPEMQCTQPCAV